MLEDRYDIESMLTLVKLTNKQRVYVEALRDLGTIYNVAKELGKSEATVRESLDRAQNRVNTASVSNHILDGQFVKANTFLLKTDPESGKQYKALDWVKTDKTKEDGYLAFKKAISGLLKKVKPVEPVEQKEISNEDTMSVYCIGDAHIGLLAWDKEVGADHDMDIAEKDLVEAMSLLTKQSVASKEALIIDVGDWFHADNMNNTTAKSGNPLDVDGRYAKVLQVGLNLAIKLIDKALEKHEHVTWRSAIGNHNEHSAIMMSAFIKAWFRNEPRVSVADTPSMYYYHVFGKNLIGITHGHTTKAEKLGEIMSVDCIDEWSNSRYRYWYTGHIHHQSVKETTSCVVETFCTLAGKDAWHNHSGYRSNQSMKAITLHKEYGEISRNTVSLSMVRANL